MILSILLNLIVVLLLLRFEVIKKLIIDSTGVDEEQFDFWAETALFALGGTVAMKAAALVVGVAYLPALLVSAGVILIGVALVRVYNRLNNESQLGGMD